MSITLRKVGDIAYAWSTDLSKVQHVRRSADFFTVFTNGSKTVVGHSYGYNLDLGVTPALEQNKAKALGPEGETVQLHVPADCTPHFAADTPLKEQMLKTVAVSTANELAFFNRNGAHYSRNLRVVIANFNEDYPETQVFIPSTGEVYHVALQNSTDPLSETTLRRESYQVQQEYRKDETEILHKKILRYAIVRDISLDGG